MKPRSVLLGLLLVFASFETLLAIVGALVGSSPSSSGLMEAVGLHVQTSPVFGYSIPLAGAGWVAVSLLVFQGRMVAGYRRSRVRSLFASRGFGADVYNLMVTMRGGGSRITLLENMETPRNRLELSELTGIDWREVDREISTLEKYRLVRVYAQTGTVKMYQMTEQGKLLMNLVEKLGRKGGS